MIKKNDKYEVCEIHAQKTVQYLIPLKLKLFVSNDDNIIIPNTEVMKKKKHMTTSQSGNIYDYHHFGYIISCVIRKCGIMCCELNH